MEDEKNRYDDVFLAPGVILKWIFIRFNPDKYTNFEGVSYNGFFDTNSSKKNSQEKEFRLHVLIEHMKHHIERIERGENAKMLEIHRLFFNGCTVNR